MEIRSEVEAFSVQKKDWVYVLFNIASGYGFDS